MKDNDLVPAEQRKHSIRRAFFSSQGLRSVWGVLFFILVFEIVETCSTRVLGLYFSLKPNGPIPPIFAFIRESCELLAVAAATWVMARVENRNLLFYGFAGPNRLGRLGAGAVWGFVALSVLILVLWETGSLVFEGIALSRLHAWGYAIAWLFVFLLVGLFEESLLRGYLQHRLTQALGFWYAATILSVAFACLHLRNGGESILGLVSVGVGGILFCISLWFTKSLFWAVGFHAGWDWGQSYFYGTPNSGLVMKGHFLASHPTGNPFWSGGAAGPEASAYLLPLFVLAALSMCLWWGRMKNPRNT
jgi:hypothetical protein